MQSIGTVTRAIMLLAAFAFAVAADAQPRPGGGSGGGGGGSPAEGLIQKIQPEQLAQIISGAGFPSQVTDLGDQRIVRTQFWPGEIVSGAWPFSCEKDGSGCHGYGLFANFGGNTGIGQDWIDSWNNYRLYVHARKDQNGDLVFQWDVLLLGGLSTDSIAASAQLFKNWVDDSTDYKP